jgi:hypothetical protein
MSAADNRTATVAKLVLLAELLASYCEAENECWTSLGHLSEALEATTAELLKLQAEPTPLALPCRIGPMGD